MTRYDSRRDQTIQRQLVHRSIGIHHEEVLVKAGIDADDILDLVVHFQFERVHRCVEVDLETRQLGQALLSTSRSCTELALTLLRKCIRIICESRFPLFPGLGLSVGLPTLTITRYGTTCPAHSYSPA